MKPHISVLTIGAADLEKSVAFYRDGLGLPTAGIWEIVYSPASIPAE